MHFDIKIEEKWKICWFENRKQRLMCKLDDR